MGRKHLEHFEAQPGRNVTVFHAGDVGKEGTDIRHGLGANHLREKIAQIVGCRDPGVQVVSVTLELGWCVPGTSGITGSGTGTLEWPNGGERAPRGRPLVTG